jgi:hypothetical protein
MPHGTHTPHHSAGVPAVVPGRVGIAASVLGEKKQHLCCASGEGIEGFKAARALLVLLEHANCAVLYKRVLSLGDTPMSRDHGCVGFDRHSIVK